jgi:hypothetical protein
MNAPPPSDELASAYLDGEVSADERAIVEADAALLARVRELRAVRQALAAPLPTRPAADVDAAIAAALAAASDADAGAPAPVPLAPRRASGRRGRIGLAVLGAAAAVVVAVVAVAALRPSDDSGTSASRVATAGSETQTAETGADAGGASIAPASAPGAASTTIAAAGAPATTAAAAASAGTGPLSLGAVDDADSLRAALTAVPPSVLSAATASAPESPCAVPDAHLAAIVVWHGTLSFVYLNEANVATVVSQSTCATLATVPLS